jgi:ribosome-binding protein aMBF1 (putative translation factor)
VAQKMTGLSFGVFLRAALDQSEYRTHSLWTNSLGHPNIFPVIRGKLHRDFGRRVRRLRDQRGFTQEQLAEKAGLHVTYLGGKEARETHRSPASAVWPKVSVQR